MPLTFNWIKIVGTLLTIISIFFFGWYEKGLRSEKDILELRKEIAESSARFEQSKSLLLERQAEITRKSDESHSQAIDTLRKYYDSLLRQRSTKERRSMSSIPSAPQSIDAIPTDALPLANQCAETTQQLEDLQRWIRSQSQSPSLP